jgi:hypothetical protein
VFLCTNLGNGPAGTQPCPTQGGTITGTITAANVGGGAAAQGIAVGEFDEFLAALRSGARTSMFILLVGQRRDQEPDRPRSWFRTSRRSLIDDHR